MSAFDPTPEEHAWLETQNVGRLRAILGGRLYWAKCDVVALDSTSDAAAVRAVLEQMGLNVRLFAVGQARHLARILSGDEGRCDYLILCGHGANGQLIVPDYRWRVTAGQAGTAEERTPSASGQPFGELVGPNEIRQVAHLDGTVVISTACGTGTREMAEAIRDAGAAAYLGPVGEPTGADVMLVLTHFFYQLSYEDGLWEAGQRSPIGVGSRQRWRLWVSDDQKTASATK